MYREVVEPARLVFTWAWEDAVGEPGHEALVTLTLASRGAKTSMTLRHAGFPSIDARDAHEGGWTESLERLFVYLRTA